MTLVEQISDYPDICRHFGSISRSFIQIIKPGKIKVLPPGMFQGESGTHFKLWTRWPLSFGCRHLK